MKAIPHIACNYAVLRFLPYPETGEFVNLGIALFAPTRGAMWAQVEKTRTKRVGDFFPELELAGYRDGRQALGRELERVGEVIRQTPDLNLKQRLFEELVRPRESVFRFGEQRTILTFDPAETAQQLFEHYVRRQFAQVREYREGIMARRYFAVLREHLPDQTFRRDARVGTDDYHVRMPIASALCGPNGEPLRAIKPLDLQLEEPTQVLDHGDAWLQRLRRLQKIGHQPARIIVPIRLPEAGECRRAADEIAQGLRDVQAEVIDAEDLTRLLQVAGT